MTSANGPQGGVALQVAVAVVIFLEVVNVNHGNRYLMLVANRLLPDAVKVNVQRAPVRQTGQPIQFRQLIKQVIDQEHGAR